MVERKYRSIRVWTGLFLLALALLVGAVLSASGVFAGAPTSPAAPARPTLPASIARRVGSLVTGILLLNIAKKPIWWFILFLIPLVNIIIAILVWMGVAEARNKPNWWGILLIVPVIGIIVSTISVPINLVVTFVLYKTYF